MTNPDPGGVLHPLPELIFVDASDGIRIDAVPGLDQDTTHVAQSGSHDLGITLDGGAVVAAMDHWLAAQKDWKPYEWQWDPNTGPPRGVARPIKTTVHTDLAPEALADHLWDNTDAEAKTHFEIALERTVTLTTETSWETKLTVGDSFTANVELSGGPVKAGASNTISVQAEIGKTSTKTESVSLGVSDAASADLDPGQAELVVLTALAGSIILVTQIQTAWEGHWLWRHRNAGEAWRKFDADTVQDHGLARPWDHGGTHWGLTTLTTKFGCAGQVDQKVEALPDTSEASIAAARKKALSEYGARNAFTYP